MDFLAGKSAQLWISFGLLLASAAVAEPAPVPGGDLTGLSLEELMNVVVTSVSKKAQPLSKTPAAAFVLTQDDIRRSGMTNLPDLLRLVPGVNVARVSSNSWAVSIRGFNERYASKTLVMVDGRPIYSVEFSGVFWDQWSVPLEDIDRIEVIRGPGGTVWGANAMNGVINIITKASSRTQGGLLAAGGGSADRTQSYLRYGGQIGKAGTYRVYGRHFDVAESDYPNRTRAVDSWTGRQVGFRTDWTLSPADTLMIDGNLNDSRQDQRVTVASTKNGFKTLTFDDTAKARVHDVLGRWNHSFRNGSEARVQFFYTHLTRDEQGLRHNDTADGEVQYRFGFGRHDVVAGGSFRYSTVSLDPEFTYRYDRDRLSATLGSTFVQDEIALSKSWSLTAGSKFERNSFTGFEFEPSAQLLWSPNDRKAAWVAVARAIRQPSFYEHYSTVDVLFPTGIGVPGVYQIQGNRDVAAETVMTFEAGYRMGTGSRVTLDVSAFRSHYEDLMTLQSTEPQFAVQPEPHILIAGRISNRAGARSHGGEAHATWRVSDTWRLTAGYSFLYLNIRRYPSSNDAAVEGYNGTSPKHQWQLGSAYRPRRDMDWDTQLFYVGSLRSNLFNTSGFTPSYLRLDTRVAWRPLESLELSVTGQNLLSPRRMEFPFDYQGFATQVQRSVIGKVVWTF